MDSSNINSFKEFVRNNPFLIGFVRDGKKSWQDLYELYDIYGEDEDVWSEFLKDSTSNDSSNSSNNKYFSDLINMAKNIDVNKVQEGISSLQKTLSLFGELFVNKNNNSSTYNPRPLYRKFDD